MEKVKLDFMVDPEYLKNQCEVPEAILVEIVDPEAIFLTGILGESGRKMILAGAPFYFTKNLANRLIIAGIAKRIL